MTVQLNFIPISGLRRDGLSDLFWSNTRSASPAQSGPAPKSHQPRQLSLLKGHRNELDDPVSENGHPGYGERQSQHDDGRRPNAPKTRRSDHRIAGDKWGWTHATLL